jgi:O-antigen/teichoic acid export membrane protein
VSVTKRIVFGAAANGLSRVVTIVLSLVLMPVLFHHLGREELGIWLLLAQTSAMLFILDLGLGWTLTRRIAQARGKSAGGPDNPLSGEALREVADLVETGRWLYLGLAISTFILSSGSGFFYLRELHLTTLTLATVWLAWCVLSLSQACGVWAQTWNCLLMGIGYVGWDSVLGSTVLTATLLVQMAAVLMGGGLMSLAVITALGLFAQRFILLGFARHRRPELFRLRGRFQSELVRGLISPALRAWATGVGSLAVMHTDPFFVASLNGAGQVPAYRAAYLVFLNLNVIATTVGGASVVFVSHLWQAGQFGEVRQLVSRNVLFGLAVMAAGGGCILGLGPRLFDCWLGQGNFIGYPILSVFFLLLFLETQAYVITLGSRATEDEAFAFGSIVAAVIKFTLAIVLGARFGLLGIASATLLAQVMTNHWYMVFRGLGRLGISLRYHFLSILLPSLGLFALTLPAVGAVREANLFHSAWGDVLASAVLAGAFLAVFLWGLVLEPSQRGQILAWRPSARFAVIARTRKSSPSSLTTRFTGEA